MEEWTRRPLLNFIRRGCRADYAGIDDEEKQIMCEIGVRNMFIQHLLQELIPRLEANGIRSIVLKGSHLIHTVYPFGIRPLEDIDLLVDPLQFEKAHQIIEQLGYSAGGGGFDLWTRQAFSRKVTYAGGRKSSPEIPIDLHFSLGPYPYLGKFRSERLFAETETVETAGGLKLTVLRPEMLVIHLSLHLFSHHFEDWDVSACDLAAVIKTSQHRMDWEKLREIMKRERISLPVAYSWKKAASLSGEEFPELWEDGEPDTGCWERWVFRSSASQQTGFDRFFLQFVTTPGLKLKLQGALRMINPGKSFLKLYYGGSYRKYIRSAVAIAVKGIRGVTKGK